jgi:hypothetical protein
MYFAILAQFLTMWLIFEVVLELFPHGEITRLRMLHPE